MNNKTDVNNQGGKMKSPDFIGPFKLPDNLKYINLSILNNVYKGNFKKILHILKMYLKFVSNEIDEIKTAALEENWEVVRAKAFAMRPKMVYLGLDSLHEDARTIEKYAEEKSNLAEILRIIDNVAEEWVDVRNEIDKFVF